MPLDVVEPPWRAEVRTPAAVAIGPGDVAAHAGVYYRTAANELRLLHLAFHFRLRDESASGGGASKMAFVVPRIPPEKLTVVAAVCQRVARASPRPPYGFKYIASGIGEDFGIVIGEGEVGFTCATFVLAVFARGQVELLDRPTWSQAPPERKAEDEAVQRKLVAILQTSRSESDRQHASKVEKDVPAPRFRAEEVAAATGITPTPVVFAVASAEGAALVAQMNESAWWLAGSAGPYSPYPR